MFGRVAWHVQELSPHVLNVNGQVLVCEWASTTYELGAMRNSWRARISRPPAELHQELFKNKAKNKGGEATQSRHPSWAFFSRTTAGGQRASQ